MYLVNLLLMMMIIFHRCYLESFSDSFSDRTGNMRTTVLCFSWFHCLLTFKRLMFPSYRNQSVDVQSKPTDWLFLYDGNIGRWKVKTTLTIFSRHFQDITKLYEINLDFSILVLLVESLFSDVISCSSNWARR